MYLKIFYNYIIVKWFRTHPPDPLPLVREGGVEVREGASPLSKTSSQFWGKKE